MQFIQIDKFNGNAAIVSKPDGSGEALLFDSFLTAQNTLAENCKNGIVVPLGNFMKALGDCADFISIIKSEEGEAVGGSLEDEVNAFLQ
jgi:hypothetical protein